MLRTQTRLESMRLIARGPLQYDEVQAHMSPPKRRVPPCEDITLAQAQLTYYVRMMLCVGEHAIPDYDLAPFGYSFVAEERGQQYKNVIRTIVTK